jgi:hypothetical protein
MTHDPKEHKFIDQREHQRFNAELPVAFMLGEVVASESAYLNNIGAGTILMLHFPVSKPVFRTLARVMRCRKMAFQFEIGAEFVEDAQVFHLRMADVVRGIEGYHQEALRAGRKVSAQLATLEWIERFGKDFLGRK